MAWGSLCCLGSACPFTVGRGDPGVLPLPQGLSRTGIQLPLFLNSPCLLSCSDALALPGMVAFVPLPNAFSALSRLQPDAQALANSTA